MASTPAAGDTQSAGPAATMRFVGTLANSVAMAEGPISPSLQERLAGGVESVAAYRPPVDHRKPLIAITIERVADAGRSPLSPFRSCLRCLILLRQVKRHHCRSQAVTVAAGFCETVLVV
jgi:hypothetical protein